VTPTNVCVLESKISGETEDKPESVREAAIAGAEAFREGF